MNKIIFLLSFISSIPLLFGTEVKIDKWIIQNFNKKITKIQLTSNQLNILGNKNQRNSIESNYFTMDTKKINPIVFTGEIMLSKGEKTPKSMVCFDVRMIYEDGTQEFQVITPAFPKEYGKWIKVSKTFTPKKPVKKLNVMCLNYFYNGKVSFRNAKVIGDFIVPKQLNKSSKLEPTVEVTNWVSKKHKSGGSALQLKSNEVSIEGDLNDRKSIASEAFILEQGEPSTISFEGEIKCTSLNRKKNSIVCYDLFLTYQDGSTSWVIITPAVPKENNKWIKVAKTFTPVKAVKKLSVFCLNYNYNGKAFFRNAKLKFLKPQIELKGVKYHTLENTLVQYTFAEHKNKVWLSSYKEKNNNFDYIENSNRKSNLYQLNLINKNKDIKIINGGGKVLFKQQNPNTLKITWQNIPLDKGNVNVSAIISLPEKSYRALWDIDVELKNSSVYLDKLVYPYLADIKVAGKLDQQFLFFPQDIGRLLTNPAKKLQAPLSISYGSWHMTMQYMAFYGMKKGWYLAAKDGNGYSKSFVFAKKPGMNSYYFSVERPLDRNAKKYHSTYSVEAGIFNGDWYDAAQIYRQWALQQKWCKAGVLAKKSNFSSILKNFGGMYLLPPHRAKISPQNAANRKKLKPHEYSLLTDKEVKEKYSIGIDEKDFIKAVLHEQNYYKFPIIYFATQAYIEPFGVSTTRYIPANGIPEVAKKLLKNNIYLMPWTSIQGMDTNIPRWKKDNAKNYVVIDSDGQPDISRFDQGCMRGQMCSATNYWKNMVYEFTGRLLNYGFRFIYYDELASSGPKKCYNPQHGHTIGGGNYGMEARREIFKTLHDKYTSKYPNFCTSGEELSEYYLDVNDGNFLYASLFDDAVPAFQAVYHDYSFSFAKGPYGKFTVQNIPAYNAEMGGASGLEDFSTSFCRNWSYGIHPGLIRPQLPEYSPIAAAMGKHFGENWLKYKKFLLFGQMLRPPKIQSPFMMTAGWKYHKELMLLPSIFASLWRSNDGEYAVSIANAQSTMQAANLTLTLKESNFKGRYCKIYDPETNEVFYSGNINNPKFKVAIPGYRSRILFIAPSNKIEQVTSKIPPYTVALEHTFTEAQKGSMQKMILRVENHTNKPATACVLASAGEKWQVLPSARLEAIIKANSFKDFTFNVIVPDGPKGRYNLSYHVELKGKVNETIHNIVPFGLKEKDKLILTKKKYNVPLLNNLPAKAIHLPKNISSFDSLEPKLSQTSKVEIPVVKSFAAWNDKGLYLSCEVQDKHHYQMASGKNIWKGDGIQFK